MSNTPEFTVAEIPDLDLYDELVDESTGLLSSVLGEPSGDIKFLMHTSDSHTFVAFNRAGRLVGVGLTMTVDNNLFVDQIGVSPDYQRQGVGTKIMKLVEEFGTDKNLESISLTPIAAREFYAGLGYVLGKDTAHKNLHN